MTPTFRKDRRSRLYFVAIPIAGTKRNKWVCTGERSLHAAEEVVSSMGVDRLLHLHNAQALTAETIALVTTGQVFSFGDIFSLWREWFEPRRSPGTAYVYIQTIRQMMKVLDCADKPIAQITEKHIREWINSGTDGYARKTIRLVAVRSLFRFAAARAYVVGNPAELVEVNRRDLTVEQLEPKKTLPFDDEEWKKILSLPVGDKWRDWSILSYCTGLRLVDCITLEWASIGADYIMAFPMKSRSRTMKSLKLPLSDPLISRPELLEVLARLRAMEHDDPIYVWPTDRLEYLTPEYASNMRSKFEVHLRHLKITGKRFHGLRVSFAQRLDAAGRTIEEIAGQMGHAKTSTTAIYLNKSQLSPAETGSPSAAVASVVVPSSALECPAVTAQ